MIDLEKPLLGAGIARVFGLTPRAIRAWAQAGCPHHPSPRGSTYLLTEVIQWRRAQDLAEAEGTTPDEAKERTLKIRAERRLAELRLRERSGELVRADTVEREWDRVLGILRSRVLALRGRWAPRIIGLTTMPEAVAVMDALADDILGALNETAEDLETETEEADEEGVA